MASSASGRAATAAMGAGVDVDEEGVAVVEGGKGKGRVAEFVGSELIRADAMLCGCCSNTVVWRG